MFVDDYVTLTKPPPVPRRETLTETIVKTIGLIDQERLIHIPKKYHAHHEFCFHLHDLMVRLLVQMEMKKSAHIRFDLESEKDRQLLETGVHILDFLNQTGREKLECRAVINQLCIALYSDMLHFIYEGLRALEKRKFSVAFTLLRKPFKDGLLIAAQMCADEESFFERMKLDAKSLLNRRRLDEERIKVLFDSTLKICSGSRLLSADKIYETVFNRTNNVGLAGLFDKATHLITEFSSIQTENYNINFIFKDPQDNDVYESGTYHEIATLLYFLSLIQIELYSRMGESSKTYQNWLIFTSLGTFEALFTTGRSRMTNFINRNFSQFLECPVCQTKLKLKKSDAPRFYIGETLDCGHCLTSQHFPLGWLLSRADLDLVDS